MASEPKSVVMDLDDLCDVWNPRATLERWHEANPEGKVTLFTIPGRSSDALLDEYAALPWVQLGMHGWWHTRGECLSWSQETVEERMKLWEDRGFARVFKAPHWMTTPEIYKAAQARNWIVADHSRNMDFWKVGMNIYAYNLKHRKQGFISVHGHTHDVTGNGIDEAFSEFCFPATQPFMWIDETVCLKRLPL